MGRVSRNPLRELLGVSIDGGRTTAQPRNHLGGGNPLHGLVAVEVVIAGVENGLKGSLHG